MGLFGGKCFLCRQKFGDRVEKHIKVADGSFKKVCPPCFGRMGGNSRTYVKPGMHPSGKVRRKGSTGKVWFY